MKVSYTRRMRMRHLGGSRFVGTDSGSAFSIRVSLKDLWRALKPIDLVLWKEVSWFKRCLLLVKVCLSSQWPQMFVFRCQNCSLDTDSDSSEADDSCSGFGVIRQLVSGVDRRPLHSLSFIRADGSTVSVIEIRYLNPTFLKALCNISDHQYKIHGVFPLWALVLITGISLAVLLLATTKRNQPPYCYKVWMAGLRRVLVSVAVRGSSVCVVLAGACLRRFRAGSGLDLRVGQRSGRSGHDAWRCAARVARPARTDTARLEQQSRRSRLRSDCRQTGLPQNGHLRLFRRTSLQSVPAQFSPFSTYVPFLSCFRSLTYCNLDLLFGIGIPFTIVTVRLGTSMQVKHLTTLISCRLQL